MKGRILINTDGSGYYRPATRAFGAKVVPGKKVHFSMMSDRVERKLWRVPRDSREHEFDCWWLKVASTDKLIDASGSVD